MSVKHIGAAEFEAEVMNSELPVILDFYAAVIMLQDLCIRLAVLCQLVSSVLAHAYIMSPSCTGNQERNITIVR